MRFRLKSPPIEKFPLYLRGAEETIAPLDFAMLFTKQRVELSQLLPGIFQAASAPGILWVCWPKKLGCRLRHETKMTSAIWA